MNRWILKIANSIVTFVVVVVLLIAGLYAGYALWDNNRIYAQAGDVQADMLKLKPKEEAAGKGASFEDLLKVNPDVCGWITIDNTAIDFPVLQGEDNLSYINRDVYGNFALAGSIFLDSRNKTDFSDAFSLLYGHHMDRSNMFGDLDLFKDELFFKENRTGKLLLPDSSYELEVLCVLLVNASDPIIFRPEVTSGEIERLLEHAEQDAMHLNADVLQTLRAEEHPEILGLSTCASEFTDARTILLCRKIAGSQKQENQQDE